jgi:hypothetical protein
MEGRQIPFVSSLARRSVVPHHPGPLLPSPPNPLTGRRGRKARRDIKDSRDSRENSENAPAEHPSPGEGDGVVGRGAGVRVLGGGDAIRAGLWAAARGDNLKK